MEPFTIKCTKCQSRIRVKDQKLVGQRVNCPKCGAALTITPPAEAATTGVEAAAQANANSGALTKESISPPPPPPSQAAPSGHADSSQQTADAIPALDSLTSFDDVNFEEEYRLQDEVMMRSTNTDVDSGSNWNPTEQEPIEESEPILPTEEWTSNESAKTKQYLLIGTLGLSGVVLAVVAFIFFLQWYSEKENSRQASAEDAINQSQPAEDALGGDEAQPAPAESDMLVDDEAVEPLGPEVTSEASDLVVEPAEDDNEQMKPLTAQVEAPDSDVNDPLFAGNDVAPLEIKPSNPEEPKVDPLALPTRLLDHGILLDYQNRPITMDTDADRLPAENPVSAAELGLDVEPIIGTPLQPVSWETVKQLTIPGVIITDRPLHEVINVAVHVCGVPIVLDEESFRTAGIPLEQSISLQQKSSWTVSEFIDAIADKLQAKAAWVQDEFISIAVPSEAMSTHLPEEISFEGLLGGLAEDDQIPWLKENLALLLSPGLPADLPVEFSVSPLVVRRGQLGMRQWAHVLGLANSWKAAAGIELGQPADMPQPLVDSERLAKLKKPLELVHFKEQPVGQLLNGVCRDLGMDCWIDWSQVDALGIGPKTTLASVTHGRTITELAREFRERMGMVAVLRSDRSILFTTQKAHRASPEIFVLPAEGRTIEQFRSEMLRLTPVDAEGVAKIRGMLTPDGKFLIVRCCRYQIR